MSRAAASDLTTTLLKQVSRSFYLSLAILPRSVRPPISLAYLLARAADTVADTRLVDRRARILHLEALRDELTEPRPGRIAAVIDAAAGPQSLPAERALIERLPAIFAAYRALDGADQSRVGRVLLTIVEGMTHDLRVFPGEDEGKLAALETRAELDRYTYLVAGCVGEFWTEIHVAHRPRLAHWDVESMKALGVRFGQGLQLTNVLRDVPRDLRQGRCYLPRQELARLGLEPGDLLDPGASAAARPLLVDLLRLALDHYRAAWTYTLAIPASEPRMRLACAWPLLIGLRTLELLAASPRWLDPDVVLKLRRRSVYGLMAQSVATVWSTRTLDAHARSARARIPL